MTKLGGTSGNELKVLKRNPINLSQKNRTSNVEAVLGLLQKTTY